MIEHIRLGINQTLDQTHFTKRIAAIVQQAAEAAQARSDAIKPTKEKIPNLLANGPVRMASAKHPAPNSSHCHHVRGRRLEVG
jgi:hypothetical protein